jgi:hypothetical protein
MLSIFSTNHSSLQDASFSSHRDVWLVENQDIQIRSIGTIGLFALFDEEIFMGKLKSWGTGGRGLIKCINL